MGIWSIRWPMVLFWILTLISIRFINAQAPTPPTLAPTPTCSGSSKPTFAMTPNKKGGSGGKSLSGLSLSQCADQCKNGKDPCAGFDYDAGSKACQVYDNIDPASLPDAQGSNFFQKACIDSNEICSSAMQFELAPQKILIGFARQVVQSPDPNDCMKQCLDAYLNLGFECQSGMYYPVDQSCILNTETRYKRPDLFVDEAQDQVLYFDNNCAGAICASSFVVQYTKTADINPKDLEGHKVSPVPSFYSCQSLCTDNIGKPGEGSSNCKSFTYSSADKSCTLFDDRILPLGRANFTAQPGTDYYEKGCYRAAETCRNVPAFTRVPQMVLVGFAAFVIDGVPSVSQCLDACLKPPDQAVQEIPNFKCMSVMYYYSEQECILNSQTRADHPDLFIPETGFQEDYFDIMCLQGQEQCANDTLPATFKIKDTMLAIANQSNIVKSGVSGSPGDCAKQCLDLSPQKCRSFNYKGSSCDLLMVNGDTELVQSTPGTDYYQIICLPTDSLGDCGKNDAIFVMSTAKINRAAGAGGAGGGGDEDGGGADLSKRKARQADGASPAPTGAKKTIGDQEPSVSLPDCMVACIKDQCGGINYNVLNGKCELFDAVGSLSDDPNTDFYQNTCAGGGGPAPTVGLQTICNFDGLKVKYSQGGKFSGAIFAKMKYDTCRVEVKDATMAMLLLGFPDKASNPPQQGGGGYGGGSSGLSSSYGSQQPQGSGYGSSQQTSGGCSLGSSNCNGRAKRQGGYGGNTGGQQPQPQPGGGSGAVFGPPTLPPRDCGVIDLKNGTYKATIIVQTNNLGIPGLVTSMDAIYEVSCDYSAFLAKKIEAKSDLHVEGPTPALIQPRGKVDLSSPVMMQLMGSGGTPILQAKLGDILELRWEMMALDDQMDFFVKECTAERGGPVAENGGFGCSAPSGCGGGPSPGGSGGYGGSPPPPPPSGGYGGSPPPPPPSGGYGGSPPPPPPSGGYGGGQPAQNGGCGAGGCQLTGGKRIRRQGYGGQQTQAPSYGAPATQAPSGYGGAPPPPPPASGGYGAAPPPPPPASGGYGAAPAPPPPASGGYGGAPPPPPPSGGYGAPPPPPSSGGYGGNSGSDCNKPGGCQLVGGGVTPSPGGGCGASGCGGQPQQPSSGGYGGGGGGGSPGGSCGPGGCVLVGGKGPNAGDPNKLKLIEKGCPTPAVATKLMPGPVKKENEKVKTAQLQAFRFDGSRSVRIICQLDICKGKCNPTTCPSGESWGKRKRETHLNNRSIIISQPYNDEDLQHYETEHYRLPKSSHTISSFVILDSSEEQSVAAPASQNNAVQDNVEHSYKDVEIESMKRGKICLPKATFLAVFIFLGSLTLIQAVAVTICLAMRFSHKKKA